MGTSAFVIAVVMGALALWYFGRFDGKPSRFQVNRVFRIAVFLEIAIEHALKEGIIDKHGNLDVEARNRKFLTYRGFLEGDVETVTKLMALKKGFRDGWVNIGREQTTFMFKLHNR